MKVYRVEGVIKESEEQRYFFSFAIEAKNKRLAANKACEFLQPSLNYQIYDVTIWLTKKRKQKQEQIIL